MAVNLNSKLHIACNALISSSDVLPSDLRRAMCAYSGSFIRLIEAKIKEKCENFDYWKFQTNLFVRLLGAPQKKPSLFCCNFLCLCLSFLRAFFFLGRSMALSSFGSISSSAFDFLALATLLSVLNSFANFRFLGFGLKLFDSFSTFFTCILHSKAFS